MPVDREGLIVDRIPAGTRLVYVTPVASVPARHDDVADSPPGAPGLGRRHDAAIIEDDYDSEFRFGGRPIEPLHTLDDSDRVIYVGSFSKTTLPTLRLGFIIAPPSLWPALHGAKFADRLAHLRAAPGGAWPSSSRRATSPGTFGACDSCTRPATG